MECRKNGTDEPVCRAGTGEEGVEKEHVDTEAGQAEIEESSATCTHCHA